LSNLDEAFAVLERPGPIAAETGGSFWNKQEPTIDALGQIVRGGMFPHQRRWWEMDEFIKVLVGGYGAGKTLIGSKRIISLALINAPLPVAVVSPTYSIATHTVVSTINGLLAGKQSILGRNFGFRLRKHPLPTFTIRYRGQEATIIVYSGDKPESLRGPNLAAAWVDEPFLQDIEIYQQMIARIRAPGAKHSELLLTGTPEQLNWGYDLCVGDLKSRHNIGVVHAGTWENKALANEYVARLRGTFDGKAGQAYIDGKFINLADGMVYYGFDNVANVMDFQPGPDTETVNGIVVPIGMEICAGIDFNVNPMSAAVFLRSGSRIHYIDELELPNADTEYLCSVLYERYGSRLIDVYPDATGTARKTAAPGGKSDFTYIRQAGLNVHARHENPKRRDRYNAANAAFKPYQGLVRATVSSRCTKLIKYLSTYSYESMQRQEAMSHLLDAATYPLAYLMPVDRIAVGTPVRITGF